MTAPRSSAAWELSVGLVEAVENDATLTAIFTKNGAQTNPGIYSMRVKAEFKDVYPRVTMKESSEIARGFFGRKGNLGTERVHIWTREQGKQQVLEIYKHLVRVWSRGVVNLDTNELVSLRVNLVTINEDPDGMTMHGVVDVADAFTLNNA